MSGVADAMRGIKTMLTNYRAGTRSLTAEEARELYPRPFGSPDARAWAFGVAMVRDYGGLEASRLADLIVATVQKERRK